MLAVAEWVAWRYEGMVPLDDPLLRIAAGYAALADARYAASLEPDNDFPDDMQDAHGPLMLLRLPLSDAWPAFVDGDVAVYQYALSMALLARHVLPDARPFERWLSATLARCAQVAPRDTANRPLPTRAFFDAPAVRDEATAAYLHALRPGRNRYPQPADALSEQGWKETPYVSD